MKKKLSIILMALLLLSTCFFIYSCKKNYSETNPQGTEVSDDLLKDAKMWHSQMTHSLAVLSNSGKKALTPLWKQSKKKRLKNGKDGVIVESPAFSLDERSELSVIRKFIFNLDGDKVIGGQIVELFGKKEYIQSHKDLFENYASGDMGDFTGGGYYI